MVKYVFTFIFVISYTNKLTYFNNFIWDIDIFFSGGGIMGLKFRGFSGRY